MGVRPGGWQGRPGRHSVGARSVPARPWQPRAGGAGGGRAGAVAGGGRRLSFARWVRRWRAAAGVAEAELADAASLSPQAVAALDRGVRRTAHKDTAVLIADALGLPAQVRIVFVAAARGKAPA